MNNIDWSSSLHKSIFINKRIENLFLKNLATNDAIRNSGELNYFDESKFHDFMYRLTPYFHGAISNRRNV